MGSYQHSADSAGNLIASGAGYATLRDYAKLGVLYLNDGVWGGEPLLPPGWVDYALTPTSTGTNYAACFRSNIGGARGSFCRARTHRSCSPGPNRGPGSCARHLAAERQ